MEEITYELKNNIAIITINRPEARNALNWTAQERFSDLIGEISINPEVRALVITGAGDKAFASGADIKELIDHETPEIGRRLQRTMSEGLRLLTELPIPVLAAVNGLAIGGGSEILTACDFRFAVSHASIRFAQITFGLTTGWGGTQRLISLIGRARAADWLMTGRYVPSQEAHQCGFFNQIVPNDNDLLAYTLKSAKSLAKWPRQGMRKVKALLNNSETMSVEEALRLEQRFFEELWGTEERINAMRRIFRQEHDQRN